MKLINYAKAQVVVNKINKIDFSLSILTKTPIIEIKIKNKPSHDFTLVELSDNFLGDINLLITAELEAERKNLISELEEC